jgi:hypothetical protein
MDHRGIVMQGIRRVRKMNDASIPFQNATTAALAIRLRASASFQEKLHQLVDSSSTKKAPEGAFHECRIRGNL